VNTLLFRQEKKKEMIEISSRIKVIKRKIGLSPSLPQKIYDIS
jgi:hypothetical protein